MTKNLKAIVAEIQKQAGPYTGNAPPVSGGGDNTGAGAPSGGGAISTSVSYTPVLEMQKSIQNLARVVTNYKTKTVRKPIPNKPGQTENVEVLTEEDPRKDFNDFVAEQYTNGAAIHGVEFDPSEDAISRDQKRPTENIDMDSVLDGLRRIGSPKPGEKVPDGIWDFRTQNAVMQVYALADAMVQITSFMGAMPQRANSTFTANDLQKFAAAIPKVKEYPATSKSNEFLNKLSPENKKHSAEVIAPLVDKLANFYQYYSKYVVDHPAYKAAVQGKTPLITAKPGGEDRGSLSPEYSNAAKDLSKLTLTNIALPSKDGKPVNFPSLPLTYLQDIKSFRSLMLSPELGYDEADINNSETQAKILNIISKHITNKLATEPTKLNLPKSMPISSEVSSKNIA
jgi:hypothetical protein